MNRERLDVAIQKIRDYTKNHKELCAAHHFLFDLPLDKEAGKPGVVMMGINPGERNGIGRPILGLPKRHGFMTSTKSQHLVEARAASTGAGMRNSSLMANGSSSQNCFSGAPTTKRSLKNALGRFGSPGT